MTIEKDERVAARAMEAGAYEEAVRLLRPLAERNSEYALYTLGVIYETGASGAPDKDAAWSYYERAAVQGSAAAYLSLGRLFMGEGQESQARAAFKAGAELGSDGCKAALARWDDYDAERLAAQAIEAGAYEEAVRLLRPLAERNSEYALLNLGWIYETGAAGASDKDAAQTYYGLASAGGSASAYLSLGRLLLSKNEETQARAALEAGAELGSGECKSELARLDDNDVERLAAQAINTGAYEEALRLLRPLAEGDSQNALLSLGWLYETGAAGASDKNAAHLCYERAT